MLAKDINIRDPFVLRQGDTYYLYGTRAKNFGIEVNGFDVYVTKDLVNFSEPISVFEDNGYFHSPSTYWAPEVHEYNGAFYMFASFTQKSGLRGTFVLKADSPLGPFSLHSDGAVTPHEWECIDGTLYIEDGVPYLVFVHEHTQILDGTICTIRLSDDLTHSVSEPVFKFSATSPKWVKRKMPLKHYITDGPFMYRSKSGKLFMIWSTFINKKYAQCITVSSNGSISGEFTHLEPIITDDGGHGMIFKFEDELMLTFHTPNQTDYERPLFVKIEDTGETLVVRH